MGSMARHAALHGGGCPAYAKVQKDKLEGWSQVINPKGRKLQ